MVSLSTKTYKKYTIHVIITVRQKLCTNEKFKSYMYVNKKHHPDSSLRRVQPYIICNRKIVFFVLSVLTAGRCKRLLCLAAHIWIVLLHLKYCVKYWGHCPRRHFLTSLKTDLHRCSSNVGHFRMSIAKWVSWKQRPLRPQRLPKTPKLENKDPSYFSPMRLKVERWRQEFWGYFSVLDWQFEEFFSF